MKQGDLNGQDLDGNLDSSFENAEIYLKSLFNSRRKDKAELFDRCVVAFEEKFGLVITANYLKTLISEGTKHSSMKMNYQLAQTNYVTQREPKMEDITRLDGCLTWSKKGSHIDRIVPIDEFLGRITKLQEECNQMNQQYREKEAMKDWAIGLLNFYDIDFANITPNLFVENGVSPQQKSKADKGEIAMEINQRKAITKEHPQVVCKICKHTDKINPALAIVMELEEAGSTKEHKCISCKVKEEMAKESRPAFEKYRKEQEIWKAKAAELLQQLKDNGVEAPRLEEVFTPAQRKKDWAKEPQKLWFMDTCDSFVE